MKPLHDHFQSAAWLMCAFGLAGSIHLGWMCWPGSRRFARPLDAGTTWRGRRLLGDHKTWRGLMAMPFAGALAFWFIAAAGASGATWLDSVYRPPAIGAFAGLAFMLAELPNSFVKRRLDVAPGATAAGASARRLFLVIDRLDSTFGALVVLWALTALDFVDGLLMLMISVSLHATFSVLLHRTGVKGRAL